MWKKAIARVNDIAVSLHCWQGDDVRGFENSGSLGGLRFENGELYLSPKFPAMLDNFECSHKVSGKGTITTAWQRESDGSCKYTVTLIGSLCCKFNGKLLQKRNRNFHYTSERKFFELINKAVL